MSMSKDGLILLVENGGYVRDPDYKAFADLSGSEARRYLGSKGFDVAGNMDTGRNGIAITSCGIRLSTNGYICKS